MQTDKKYTIEQLHQAFIHYLMNKFDSDLSEVNPFIETAEQIIPDTLNDYFGANITTIYDLQDCNDIDDFRMKIKAHSLLKNIDNRAEPRYTDVLKWYRLFIKSLYYDSAPIPVPGENEPGQVTEKDSSNKPVVQSTVYLEGESAKYQTKEIRYRNMLLREACIDYYKTKHDGRIVCECCGFDFSKAYMIDDEYIEVHHKFPFSQTEGEHPVNSQTDLVPLCANCHRMIHHGQGGNGNCMTLEQLQNIYKGIKFND